MAYDKKQLGKKIMAGKAAKKAAVTKKAAPQRKKAAPAPWLTRVSCQPITDKLPACELTPPPPVGAAEQILDILRNYRPGDQNEIVAAVLQKVMKWRHTTIDEAVQNRSLAMDREDKAHIDCKRLHEVLTGSAPSDKVIPSSGDLSAANGIGIGINGVSKY